MKWTATQILAASITLLAAPPAFAAGESVVGAPDSPPPAATGPAGAALAPVSPFGPGPVPGGLPPLPGGPSADPALGAAAAPDLGMSPPPLSSLTAGNGTSTSTTGTVTAGGPIEAYEFLYREDDDMGVVRERYSSDEAKRRKEAEIARLISKYGQPQVIGAQPGPAGQQGVDPRAAAEWDFYFEQLQMYSDFVKTKVLRTEDEEFPEPTFEVGGGQSGVIQEVLALKDTYQGAASNLVNEQWNDSQAFYERLEAREDRRREFRIWVQDRERELQRSAEIWGRQISGRTWTDGQPVSRDDWYYGTHFNAATPVQTEIGGQDFLFSREPQNYVGPTTLNVLSTNLTPYDVVDHHGTLKSPEVERVRGSLVRPLPMAPAPTPAPPPATGSVEMAY